MQHKDCAALPAASSLKSPGIIRLSVSGCHDCMSSMLYKVATGIKMRSVWSSFCVVGQRGASSI